MLTLLGFSFFSVTILGKSDVTLLDAAATVKIPFAETEIGFVDFLIIAPFVLVGIAVYMHVFIGYWRLLQIPEDGNPGLPFLFNVSHPGAWLLSQAVFYGLVPTVLCYFSYKSSPRPEGQVMASFALAVTLGFLWLAMRRSSSESTSFTPRLIGTGCVLVVAGLLVLSVLVANPFSRPLSLFRARLPAADLRDAVLIKADLREAVLTKANLSKADLSEADLNEATLFQADLREADLREADLSGANLREADLRGANLVWADLSGANLVWADLSGANLFQADLRGADLLEADLIGANLRAADLRGARFLTQGQINNTTGDKDTKLPEGLTMPQRWLEDSGDSTK